jgi:hypothetical protein
MLLQQSNSRRQFVASASLLALTAVIKIKSEPQPENVPDDFVVVNGWVLKRSEAA